MHNVSLMIQNTFLHCHAKVMCAMIACLCVRLNLLWVNGVWKVIAVLISSDILIYQSVEHAIVPWSDEHCTIWQEWCWACLLNLSRDIDRLIIAISISLSLPLSGLSYFILYQHECWIGALWCLQMRLGQHTAAAVISIMEAVYCMCRNAKAWESKEFVAWYRGIC